MTEIILPHISGDKMHDGLLMKWPQRCQRCTTRECRNPVTDLGLCSYGYNYTHINNMVLAGFICSEDRSSSRAKTKNLKSEKLQTINLHLVESQKSTIRHEIFE